MFEDSLDISNKALEIEPDNYKALLRNAKSLAFLYEFEKAINILSSMKKD